MKEPEARMLGSSRRQAVGMELKEGEVLAKDATGILHNVKTRRGC